MVNKKIEFELKPVDKIPKSIKKRKLKIDELEKKWYEETFNRDYPIKKEGIIKQTRLTNDEMNGFNVGDIVKFIDSNIKHLLKIDKIYRDWGMFGLVKLDNGKGFYAFCSVEGITKV